MIILALLLQTESLVHYRDLPVPSVVGVQSCARDFNRLQDYASRVKTYTFSKELDRGGRMTWRQANNVRYAVDLTARPYMERLRQIAYKGNMHSCRALADAGIAEINDRVVNPVFGN